MGAITKYPLLFIIALLLVAISALLAIANYNTDGTIGGTPTKALYAFVAGYLVYLLSVSVSK